MATAPKQAAAGRDAALATIHLHAEMLRSLGWFLKHVEQAPEMSIGRGMAKAANHSAECILRAIDDRDIPRRSQQVPDEPEKLASLRSDACAAAELARGLYGYERMPGCLEELQRGGEELWSVGDEILDTLADWEGADWGRPVNQARPELSVVDCSGTAATVVEDFAGVSAPTEVMDLERADRLLAELWYAVNVAQHAVGFQRDRERIEEASPHLCEGGVADYLAARGWHACERLQGITDELSRLLGVDWSWSELPAAVRKEIEAAL